MTQKKKPKKYDLLIGKPIKPYDPFTRALDAVSPIPDDQGQYDGISPEQKKAERLKIFNKNMNDMSEKLTDYYKSKAFGDGIDPTDIDKLEKLSPHAQYGYLRQRIEMYPELLNDPEFTSRISPEFLNLMRGKLLTR